MGLQQFRLPQLSSAAKSALFFYDWLVNRAALPVPLATCRLLLGPSLDELHDQPNPSTAQPVTTDDFVMAASGWIQDARRSESEMTIFYFCGHKLQVSREEDILLFQNFGSAIGPSFRGGVSFANIFNGLGQGTIPIAQTQLYFLDGSRHLASRSSLGTLLYGSTDVFDVWLGGPDRRSAAVFQAAAPGDQAYAYRNQVSLFTEALVRGLDGAAAVPQNLAALGQSEWVVTIASLSRWLGATGQRLAQEHSLPITFMTSGLLRESVITKIQRPPMVDVEIRIEPAHVAMDANLIIEDQNGRQILNLVHLSPRHHLRLEPGFYALGIRPQGPESEMKARRQLIQVLPSDSPLVVVMSA